MSEKQGVVVVVVVGELLGDAGGVIWTAKGSGKGTRGRCQLGDEKRNIVGNTLKKNTKTAWCTPSNCNPTTNY